MFDKKPIMEFERRHDVYITKMVIYAISRWPSSNTLASNTSGPGTTPGQCTLVDDLAFHPIMVGKLSTSFGWESVVGIRCSGMCSGMALVLINKVRLHRAWLVTG
jgi:hypothetical protein